MRRYSWGELLTDLPTFEGPLGAGGETSFTPCGLCWKPRPCFFLAPGARVVGERGLRANPSQVCLGCLRGESGWRVTLDAPGILRRAAVLPPLPLLACA